MFKTCLSYSLFILLFLLLISGCKFESLDKEKSDEVSENPDSTIGIKKDTPKIISQKGIYVLSDFWLQEEQDSLKLFDHKFNFLIGQTNLIFVLQSEDSIGINVSKPSYKKPVIFFNEIDGPIVTSFDRLSFYMPLKKKDELIEEVEVVDMEKLEKIIEPHPIVQITKINPKKIYSINTDSEIIWPVRSIGSPERHYPFLSNSKNLQIYFDNDFWYLTDYYYTNGIRLGYIDPIFVHSPISLLLVSNGSNGIDFYGIQLIQNMYTGSQPKVDSIIKGDRPWAAYSVIGQNAQSFDYKNKLKHSSEFNIGVLGPKSGGGFLQNLVHAILPNNSPPAGWDNQIKTDIIIDYQYEILKLLYESKRFESYARGSIQVGSLRDNLKWGFGARYGIFRPFYLEPWTNEKTEENRQLFYSFYLDFETQLIGYDATLQGGVTDRTSVYVIPTRDMERFVIQGRLGLELRYQKIHLQLIQFWKSKEFRTGMDHKYMSVRLFFEF